MLWIAPLLKICFFRFYAEGIKLSCTTCLVEALTTQCGIVIKVIILTLSTTLSCSSILIHILDSWFILTLHQENFKWTIAQKSSTLLGPAYLIGRFISPFELGWFYTPFTQAWYWAVCYPGWSLATIVEVHLPISGPITNLSPRCLVTLADP